MALGKSPAEIIESGAFPLLSVAPHWERVPLGDVATVQNGAAFGSEFFTHGDGMPLIRIRDVRRDFTENHYNGPFEKEFVVRNGDLLIGMDGDFHAAIWKGPNGLLNQRVCRLIQKTELYSRDFLFIALQPYLNAINAETSSVTVKHLSSRTIAEIPLPLPPLAEQKRIVAKIEELFSELDAGEESLRRARRQLGVYRQSLLKQAFEGKLTAPWRAQHPDLLESPDQLLARIQAERQARYQQHLKDWEKSVKAWDKAGRKDKRPAKPRQQKPLRNPGREQLASLPSPPKEWAWVHIDCYVAPESNAIKAGPFGSALKKEDYVPAGYKIYGQEQVISGNPYFGDYFIDQKKYDLLANCAVKPGDILISLVGTVGKVLVLPDDAAPGIINPRLIKITASGFLHPHFFKLYFESAFLKSLYKLETHGATMDVLNLGIIESLPFPLCSLPEQQEIVRLLDEQFTVIEQNEREIDAALKRSEALRQSILKKAFTGQLIPQDPADEPASTLLERIRRKREAAEAKKPPKKRARKQASR